MLDMMESKSVTPDQGDAEDLAEDRRFTRSPAVRSPGHLDERPDRPRGPGRRSCNDAEGLRVLLRNAPDISVVGEAENGATAVAMARRVEPDIVVLDLDMPVADGRRRGCWRPP
jgi:CheY-like chemotaxis protein